MQERQIWTMRRMAKVAIIGALGGVAVIAGDAVHAHHNVSSSKRPLIASSSLSTGHPSIPHGQVPEVPWAGILPGVALAPIGLVTRRSMMPRTGRP